MEAETGLLNQDAFKIKDAGSDDAQAETYDKYIRRLVDAQVAIATLVRKRLQSLSAEESAQLYDMLLRSAMQVRDRGGKLIYPYGAVFCVSRRPLD